MKASITFKEIEKIVKCTAEKVVTIKETTEQNSMLVSYPVEVKIPLLGMKTVNVEALVTIGSINGLDLSVSYSLIGLGQKMVASMLTTFLGGYIERTGLLSWGEDHNHVILHLDKIALEADFENIYEIAEVARINTITVKGDEVIVDADIFYKQSE